MTALGPLETAKVEKAFCTPAGMVLGLEFHYVLKITNRSIGLKLSEHVDTDPNAVTEFSKVLDLVPEGSVGKLLSDLIEMAERHMEQGKVFLDDVQLDKCKKLRDDIIAKENLDKQESAGKHAKEPSEPKHNGWPMAGQFHTSNKTFHTMMINSILFHVPKYQRSFRWTLDQHEDLWQDIKEARRTKTQHFLGFVVFRQKGTARIEVLDGQQRLVSLLIIVVAAMMRLKELADAELEPEYCERLRHAMRQIVEPLNTEHGVREKKFQLSEEDYVHFIHLVERQVIWRDGSNKHLNNALRFYLEQFQQCATGEEVNSHVQAVYHALYFTEIFVPTETVAHELFESLNNRGLQMAVSDMIKNLLISSLQGTHVTVDFGIGKRWDEVIEGLKGASLGDYFKAVRMRAGHAGGERHLHRQVRKIASNHHDAMDLVSELETLLPTYQAFTGNNDHLLNASTDGSSMVVDLVRTLNLFGATSHIGVAMAALEVLKRKEMEAFMKILLNVEIRRNFVCSQPRNELERCYAAVAQDLRQDKAGLREARRRIAARCPSDEAFKKDFRFMTLPAKASAQQAVYLLRTLEGQASKDPSRPADAANLTIEHVLPQNPDEWWQEHFGEDAPKKFTNRIGNLALLSARSNSMLGRAKVEEKFTELRKTGIEINKHLATGEVWNLDALDRHQHYLAELAVRAWPLP